MTDSKPTAKEVRDSIKRLKTYFAWLDNLDYPDPYPKENLRGDIFDLIAAVNAYPTLLAQRDLLLEACKTAAEDADEAYRHIADGEHDTWVICEQLAATHKALVAAIKQCEQTADRKE